MRYDANVPLPPTFSLKALRGFRNPRERDLTIAAAVGVLQREVEKQHRQVDGAGDAWAEVVPAELAARTALVRLARGVLNVRAADSGARFALDRFLRSGGEQALVRASRGKIKRVKLL
jgi:hypothetical protein